MQCSCQAVTNHIYLPELPNVLYSSVLINVQMAHAIAKIIMKCGDYFVLSLPGKCPFAVEVKGLLIYPLHVAAPDHQRLHLHPRGGGPGQVPRHHVPPQGRLLQVQGQNRRRPHLGSQHHHGCAKPRGLSREQHFKFQNCVGYTEK